MDTTLQKTDNALVVTTQRPLDQNPAAVYLRSLSAGSYPTALGALNEIARMLGVPEVRNERGREVTCLYCDWAQVRFQHTAAIRAQLASSGSPNTTKKKLSFLKNVLRAAKRLGQMGGDDYQNAIDLSPVTGSRLPAGRMLNEDEIAAIIGACQKDATVIGVRDTAIIALLCSTGMRRAEVCSLDLASYHTDTDSLTVIGKRNKERYLPLHGGALEALDEWIRIRGREAGPLFPSKRNSRLTPWAINFILGKRADEAGIEVSLSPHDFRRTFASTLLDRGADIVTVQHVMGHSSVVTTALYDRRGEKAAKAAVRLVDIPYHGQRREGVPA